MNTTIENYCIDCKAVAQPDCDERGHVVGTLGRTTQITGNESPAPRAGESEQWRVFEHYRKRILNAEGVLVAEAQTEEEAEQIVTEHNQYSTLVAQRDRLLQLLRPVTSPTSCYCAVMRDEKCWHCEARELIATIEQEGKS